MGCIWNGMAYRKTCFWPRGGTKRFGWRGRRGSCAGFFLITGFMWGVVGPAGLVAVFTVWNLGKAFLVSLMVSGDANRKLGSTSGVGELHDFDIWSWRQGITV